MFTYCKVLSAFGLLCFAASCGVDATPGGPPPEAQSEYNEAEPLSCATMNGRSFVISLQDGPPATDTIIFASDRIESVGSIGSGLGAFPYTCSGGDSLRVGAEMRGGTDVEVRWEITILGDDIQGTVTLSGSADPATETRTFTGRALAGTGATLRTPQRQVETL